MAKAPPTPQEVDEHRRDLLAKHTGVITPFLQPGEPLTGVVMVALRAGKEPPAKYLAQGSRLDRILARAGRAEDVMDFGVPNAFWGAVSKAARVPAAMQGGWDSHAGSFAITVWAAAKQDNTSSRQFSLAFTGHRVLILTRPSLYGVKPLRMLGEIPPSEIAAPPGWHPGMKSASDIDLLFSDGSSIAVGTDTKADTSLLAQLLGSPPA